MLDRLKRLLERPTIWREAAVAAAGLLALLTLLTAAWPTDYLLRLNHSWHMFHYVIGTKYFDELGYFDMYNGVLLADRQQKGVFRNVPGTRDMTTYRWIPTSEALRQAQARGVRKRFTDERWRELKQDLASVGRMRSMAKWTYPMVDRGYNPSPAWMGPHRWLLNAVDLQSKRTLFLLGQAQLVFYILTFAVAWWAFGGKLATIGALWFLLYYGSWSMLGGGYFFADWFFLTICGVALYRKDRPVAAGALLSFAAMSRIFPGFLAIHAGVSWLAAVVRRRRPASKHTRLLVALALGCAALFLVGSSSQRGVGAWQQWRAKISIHSQKHQYTPNTVGFRHLLNYDPRQGWDPTLEQAERRNAPYNTQNLALGMGLMLLTVLAMVRRNDHDGMLLGLPAFFFVTVLSRYYMGIGALLLTWTGDKLSHHKRWLGSMWLWTLVGVGILQILLHVRPRQLYLFFNTGLTIYFVEMVATFLVQDLARLRSRIGGAR